MKRWTVLGPLCGVVVGLIAFAIGVQGWRPVLMGVVVAVFLVWGSRHWPEGMHRRWPRIGGRVYGGGSHQVSRLASVISRHSQARSLPDPGLQYRLRRLAAARLHRRGVAWHDARAAELLGADVHAALTAETFQPGLDGLEKIVGAIERLDGPERFGVGAGTVRHGGRQA